MAVCPVGMSRLIDSCVLCGLFLWMIGSCVPYG